MVGHRPSLFFASSLLCALASATGCADQVTLRVELISDFIPGVEASSAIVELSDGQRRERSIGTADSLSDQPFRLATFEVPPGNYTVDVQLLSPRDLLGEASTVTELQRDLTISVMILRGDCSGAGCNPTCRPDDADCGVDPMGDGGVRDTGWGDAGIEDAARDVGPVEDASLTDGDVNDSSVDSGNDSSMDSGNDSSMDSGVDAEQEAGPTVDTGADTAPPDSGSEPEIVVEETASQLTLTATGRFRLVFSALHDWQPNDWFDLMTDPTLDLGGLNSGAARLDVLQTPLNVQTVEWYTQDEATNAELLGWRQLSAGTVEVETRWLWNDRGRMLTMTATHTIASSGRWQVNVMLTTDRDTLIEAHEFGYTTMNRLSSWSLIETTNSFTWRRDGIGLQPSIRITHARPGCGRKRSIGECLLHRGCRSHDWRRHATFGDVGESDLATDRVSTNRTHRGHRPPASP